MKVSAEHLTTVGHARRAGAIALASLLMAIVGFVPTPAAAITRPAVIARAHHWVDKRVIYSQSRTYGGYRRDCSGFVSMAWRLRISYTSRTIHRVAKRIPLSKLRAGDAVHTPGHVTVFVKWKSKRRHTYVAMEEANWGRPALRRVRSLGRGATALRYHRITEKKKAPAAVAPPAPSAETTPIVAVPVVTPDVIVLPGTSIQTLLTRAGLWPVPASIESGPIAYEPA